MKAQAIKDYSFLSLPPSLRMQTYFRLSLVSKNTYFFGGNKRQPEIGLRSQAVCPQTTPSIYLPSKGTGQEKNSKRQICFLHPCKSSKRT